MSSRTSMAALNTQAFYEQGPSTKTLENFDVSAGNKIEWSPTTVLQVRNTTGGSLNLTFAYHDALGQARTKVTEIGANEETVLGPFHPKDVYTRHTGDAEDGTHVWVTADGTAGQLKGRAIRLPRPQS